MADAPGNVHVSSHPCLKAKLSKLRSNLTNARDFKSLLHEISLIVGCEALSVGLAVKSQSTDVSPLGYEYPVDTLSPSHISLMPILRSGLAMMDAMQMLLPEPVPVHHLGLFREKTTMTAVEYYNNLPYHRPSVSDPSPSSGPSELTILVDPVIATGATACAAIDTLREWGVKKILMIAILASEPGLRRAAEHWKEGVEIFVAGMDPETDDQGMIKPGLGDVGDRLFLTIGK